MLSMTGLNVYEECPWPFGISTQKEHEAGQTGFGGGFELQLRV